MITNGYEKQKKIVLDYYDSYRKLIDSTNHRESGKIKEEAEKIKNEIFNLMIIGEAKSGKSTFINAFLGHDILPMDVLQCTSAIIKIRYGRNLKLVATTADNTVITKTTEKEIKDFLSTNAAIPDAYRQLPFVQIDEFIIQMMKKKRTINEGSIASFFQKLPKGGISISDEEYKKLVTEYIDDRKSKWASIITNLELTYKLNEEFSGITIFDSPGVGAEGYVGEITENHINQANAIVFVKSLNGQAIESSSFVNFFMENCKDKQKENLFLVFTGCANVEDNELPRYKEQAVKYYQKYLNPKKIIFVDSKMELYLNHCIELGTTEKISDFFDKLDSEKKTYVPASYSWYKSMGNVNKFIKLVNEKSNFDEVRTVLEKFAYHANFLQLKNFMEAMAIELKSLKKKKVHLNNLLLEDLENEKDLETNIAKCKKDLQKTLDALKDGLERVNNDYVGGKGKDKGIITKKKEELKAKYEVRLKNYEILSDSQINNNTYLQLKNMTINAIDEAHLFQRVVAKELIQKCNEKLIEVANINDKISMDFVQPNFTESDFERIKKKAEDDTDVFHEGGCFEDDYWTHHPAEVVRILINHISIAIDAITDKMEEHTVDYANECLAEYKSKLELRVTVLQGDYGNLLSMKNDYVKKRETVNYFKSIIKDIENDLLVNDNITRGIEEYVK